MQEKTNNLPCNLQHCFRCERYLQLLQSSQPMFIVLVSLRSVVLAHRTVESTEFRAAIYVIKKTM
jgi:hypothetical protein